MSGLRAFLSAPGDDSTPAGMSREEYECRVALLLSKGVNDALMAQSLMLSFDNDVDSAFQYFDDLTAASLGTILPPTPHLLEHGGFENAGNSCYIDSLVFAMFSLNTRFDGLLVKEFADIRTTRLQVNLIIMVNQLRRGLKVKAGTVRNIGSTPHHTLLHTVFSVDSLLKWLAST